MSLANRVFWNEYILQSFAQHRAGALVAPDLGEIQGELAALPNIKLGELVEAQLACQARWWKVVEACARSWKVGGLVEGAARRLPPLALVRVQRQTRLLSGRQAPGEAAGRILHAAMCALCHTRGAAWGAQAGRRAPCPLQSWRPTPRPGRGAHK